MGASVEMRTGMAALVLMLATAAGAAGQNGATAADVAALSEALVEAQESHLGRVAVWGGASLLAGLGILAATRGAERPGWRGFGIQSAAWGAINLGIVGAATAAGPMESGPGLAAALSAEDGYGNILLVNLGLNVGYIGVGTALAIAAGRGLRSGDAVRGHGLGVVVQGLGLLVLDGVAYAGSRSRMQSLQSLVEAVEVGWLTGGPGLVATFPLPL